MFADVEKQLIADLAHYGVTGDLSLDWSDACIEGHSTQLPEGPVHNWSNVGVNDKSGRLVAGGWIDFIHGGNHNPLFVFWRRLTIIDPITGKQRSAMSGDGIPPHVWDRLTATTKDLCMKSEGYDSMWAHDPLVEQWRAIALER